MGDDAKAVFGIEDKTGRHLMVAAPNKAQASKLLGASHYRMVNFQLSLDQQAIALARSRPGVVMERTDTGWQPLSDLTIQRDGRGGKREGAGQTDADPTSPRSLRFSDSDWALIRRLGGSKYMRKVAHAGLTLSEEEWEQLAKVGGVSWLRAQLKRALSP